jgi:hypothetical protein
MRKDYCLYVRTYTVKRYIVHTSPIYNNIAFEGIPLQRKTFPILWLVSHNSKTEGKARQKTRCFFLFHLLGDCLFMVSQK